jgi:CcmD family protein
MNGMVQDSWTYVVAAYAVTFVVLAGYSIRLILMKRRLDASDISSR